MWNRFGRVEIYYGLFLSFGVGTERRNIYLGISMPFTFVALFLEDKKRCPFTPKTFVPQHWSGFLDMCFFEVKILFCSGFFLWRNKHKQNNDFQKQVWGVPILEITSFEGFKQTVSFIQFGGMKRRNTGWIYGMFSHWPLKWIQEEKITTSAPLECICLTSLITRVYGNDIDSLRNNVFCCHVDTIPGNQARLKLKWWDVIEEAFNHSEKAAAKEAACRKRISG